MPTYAKGCKKPDPAKLAKHKNARSHRIVGARVAEGRFAGGLPPSADGLGPRLRLNQGASGSCTWGSAAAAVYLACQSLGMPLPFIPSQRSGYADTRAWARGTAPAQVGPLADITDSGADLEDVWAVMSSIGVRPMLVEQTPDGRHYDIWSEDDVAGMDGQVGNVNDEPAPLDLEVSGASLIRLDTASHIINPADPLVMDLICASLSNDQPLPIEAAGFVDTAFENLQPGQVALAPDASDPKGGGHAFHFRAYRTIPTGAREIFLDNTWGEAWCEDGGCWVSEAFIRSLWAMYVMDVQVTFMKGGGA